MFDEDTGETEIIPNMTFYWYHRPLMLLVDHDYCQEK